MGYRSLESCVRDLKANGHLVDVDVPLEARLEIAEVQRRVYRSGGPALLFSKVNDCPFPMLGNLFGSLERARFVFRDTYDDVGRAIRLKADPSAIRKSPWAHRRLPLVGWRMLPKKVKRGPVAQRETTISQLPQLQSWPDDGGAFITLPQVFTWDVTKPGLSASNLGMYRVQLSGDHYQPDQEIGLHYQIHRGIGVQHQKAIAAGQRFPVAIFVGGSPAMTLSAVMPLPEGMSELGFAGALAGHRIPMMTTPQSQGLPIYAEADFCICGYVDGKETRPEGPFGDHLGYYSLQHEFPLMHVTAVYHRENAIWPFTVVGRPPQEDTTFGQLIHELTGSVIPTVLPGVDSVHAVDAAGVHPLLLAIGNERYNAYRQLDRPQELLTQANAILGQGQMSLAKYLLILNRQDLPHLDIHHAEDFFQALLERIDWKRDLHFQTQTTIDTLDYSGEGLNAGSKVVLAAVGPAVRTLPTEIDHRLRLPEEFGDPHCVTAGILAIRGPAHESIARAGQGEDASSRRDSSPSLHRLAELPPSHPINDFPLIVLCDDPEFVARRFDNFLWVTFTRSNPAIDIAGIGQETRHKHWGCRGSLIIDARLKAHHAPPLIEDPAVSRKIDALAASGHPVSRWL